MSMYVSVCIYIYMYIDIYRVTLTQLRLTSACLKLLDSNQCYSNSKGSPFSDPHAEGGTIYHYYHYDYDYDYDYYYH